MKKYLLLAASFGFAYAASPDFSGHSVHQQPHTYWDESQRYASSTEESDEAVEDLLGLEKPKLVRQNAIYPAETTEFTSSLGHNPRTKRQKPAPTSEEDLALTNRLASAASYTELDEMARKFNVRMKSIVAKFIPQVFKIYVNTSDGAHSGTGFMFDAARGIVLTNLHVAMQEFSQYTVETRDGKRFKKGDVEIIGSSPDEAFGDFAFLRIKKLIGKFQQMEMDSETKIVLYDPIAYMGNSAGNFAVCEGHVNELYNFQLEKIVHSVHVHLRVSGGASGSPTFNEQGKVNGLLFAGDTDHTLFLPIKNVQRAYNKLLRPHRFREFSPVSVSAFSAQYQIATVEEISEFFRIPEDELMKYVPENQARDRKFLEVYKPFRSKDAESLLLNDVILAVNGENIGIDTIKLAELIDDKDSVDITVVRDAEIQDLKDVKVFSWQQSFAKRILIDDEVIADVNASCHDLEQHIEGAQILRESHGLASLFGGGGAESRGLIDRIHKTKVTTFDEVARELHQQYNIEENEKISFFMKKANGNPWGVEYSDLSTRTGLDLTVQYFDYTKHAWKQISLSEYVRGLDA